MSGSWARTSHGALATFESLSAAAVGAGGEVAEGAEGAEGDGSLPWKLLEMIGAGKEVVLYAHGHRIGDGVVDAHGHSIG